MRPLTVPAGATGIKEASADDRLLGVVIVTFNSADDLPGLLDSLGDGLAGIERYEVIVVDNQSHDHSVAIAEQHPIGARVVRSPVNGGYAAGINLAAAQLPPGADMLVLNPDLRLCPGSVAQLVARARDEAVGVAAPMIRNSDASLATSLRREPSLAGAWWQALLGPTLAGRMGLGDIIADPAYYRQGRRIEWATGAILLVTARAREKVGEWDESFFLYSEEVDYQRRVRQAGLGVVYVPEAEVFHAGGGYKRSPGLTAIMTSNQIRDYARHHGALPTLLFRGALLTFGLLRCWRSGTHRAVLRVALSPLRPPRHYVAQDRRT